jgi:hypothetical protein
MPEPKRHFLQSRAYDLQLQIKDLDYTHDLTGVQIISSLSTAYQIIKLHLLVDPRDVIVEDIFGKTPIKLRIRLLVEDQQIHEDIKFELMYIKSDSQITEASESTDKIQQDRAPLVIQTVCRKPFKTMNSLVNKVYMNKKIREILEELTSDVGADLTYDSDGENKELVDQICIPPTTLYKIVKEYDGSNIDSFDGFLDQRYGLHEGVSSVFCQYDNKLYIKNLTAKMNKNQVFTIHQLAEQKDNTKTIEKSMDGKNFYVYDTIDSDYSGNAKFSVIAPTINHIVKPKDTLFSVINQKLQDVCSTYSLKHKNDNMNIDSEITRTKYYNEDTGYEKTENLFNARLGRSVSDTATLGINLERNFKILTLMNVGEVVKFKTGTLQYVPLTGKYILWSSLINFTKSGEWENTVRLNLMRTNKKIF